MDSPEQLPFPLREHSIEIRVRYQETDAQGRVHHANYINYFEVARVEMLRAGGRNYRDLELGGLFLVVVDVQCQYYGGAIYDDVLRVDIAVDWTKGTRIRHSYKIWRDQELVAEGHTVVASVSPEGKVLRLPKWLRGNGEV
ncbi:MAG: thioesterase family protein [Pirellulaceae bacterium]